MTELEETGKKPARAFLVGIRNSGDDLEEAASLSAELCGLAETLGVEVLDQTLVHVRERNVRFGMGSGNAEIVAQRAAELEADCIIFDQDISPSQQRNWEKLAERPILDRQELILQIFASRAKTKEAALQVELANLKYSLPRLAHAYIDLSRQRGGRYGTKGSGETRLEMDRRAIQRRIHVLNEELIEVRKQRATQRKRREKIQVPTCALVGYTNAGKSSLLNAMTSSESFVEDKLFATLDPTTRRLVLGNGRPVLLTDTVGFIRRLPHNLVEAFSATLEEAAMATLILHVLDASDPDVLKHWTTTMAVLEDLEAADHQMLMVLNKADLAKDESLNAELRSRFPEAVWVSAKSAQGLEELSVAIDKTLSGAVLTFSFPVDRHDLVALLHRSGTVESENYLDTSIEVSARVDERIATSLAEFRVD